jgi:hypothetical protein
MFKRFIRTLRTNSSERFILQAKEGEDSAVLDLHYLASGNVAGTLILFENGGILDSEVPDILNYIDEVLLPEVNIEHHRVAFSVVRGRVIGDFAPHST